MHFIKTNTGLGQKWSLGCLNLPPSATGSQEAAFTQPRVYSLAHRCISCNQRVCLLVHLTSSNPLPTCGLLSRVPRCGSGSAAGVSGSQHGHHRSPRLPHPLRGLRRHALLHPEEEIRQCVCAAGKHPQYNLGRQLVKCTVNVL